MKVVLRKSYIRDEKKLKNVQVLEQSIETVECLKKADTLRDVVNVKKITGYKNRYRIRIGSYRIGIEVVGDVVYMVRLLLRDDNTYSKFP